LYQALEPCSPLPSHMTHSPLGSLIELPASSPPFLIWCLRCLLDQCLPAATPCLPAPSSVHISKRPASTPCPTLTSHRLSEMPWLLCCWRRMVTASASPANGIPHLAEARNDRLAIESAPTHAPVADSVAPLGSQLLLSGNSMHVTDTRASAEAKCRRFKI
jgi:hypothetical protein